jgi:hypothetical protein
MNEMFTLIFMKKIYTYVRYIKVIAAMVTTVTVFRVNPKYLY